MQELKKEMKDVIKDLKKLTRTAERMAIKLEKLEKTSTEKAKKAAKPATAKKAPAKKPASRKATKMSASDTILNIIKNRKTPIDTVTLKNKTGFKDNNIRMIVYRLKKRGEIRSVRKGVYQRA